MKTIDLKAVKEVRASLAKLAREHPELIDESTPRAVLVRQWESTLKEIFMKGKLAFSLKEAAELLDCHPDTLRRAIKNGKLKAAKLDKNYRISKTDLAEYYRSMGGGELFPLQENQD